MRASFVFAAVAGVAVGFLGAPGANAMTGTSPAGVRVATEAMDTSALVHCRPYRHWHRWEHRWTHGCHGGVEADVVIRRGHRERVHEGSRTTIRSGTTTREQTTIRSGTGTGTSTTGETSTKSGTSGGGTTSRSQGGAKPSTSGGSTGGSSSGPAGGTSGTQSGGPKQ